MFVEKPWHGRPGLRRIWAACDEAKEKNLAVVSGLCYRYQNAKRATIEKIREGAIGEIKAIECSYDTGGLWHRGQKPEWSEMETQLRNWLYYTWASGDHIAEQAIHNLDKMIWTMGDKPPLSVKANGGRIVRTDPKYGNIYDHFSAVYDFGDGVKGFFSCRQSGAFRGVSDHAFRRRVSRTCSPTGSRARRTGATGTRVPDNMYQNEHNELFASIRRQAIHNGDYMCRATLAAHGADVRLLGRSLLESGAGVQGGPRPQGLRLRRQSVKPVAQPMSPSLRRLEELPGGSLLRSPRDRSRRAQSVELGGHDRPRSPSARLRLTRPPPRAPDPDRVSPDPRLDRGGRHPPGPADVMNPSPWPSSWPWRCRRWWTSSRRGPLSRAVRWPDHVLGALLLVIVGVVASS